MAIKLANQTAVPSIPGNEFRGGDSGSLFLQGPLVMVRHRRPRLVDFGMGPIETNMNGMSDIHEYS